MPRLSLMVSQVSTESVTTALDNAVGPSTLGDVRGTGGCSSSARENLPSTAKPPEAPPERSDDGGGGGGGAAEGGGASDSVAAGFRSSAAKLHKVQEEIDAARRRYKPVASTRLRRKSLADIGSLAYGGVHAGVGVGEDGGGGTSRGAKGGGGVKRNTSMERIAITARLRNRYSADRLPTMRGVAVPAPAADRDSQESGIGSGSTVAGSASRLVPPRRAGSITKTSDSMRLEM